MNSQKALILGAMFSIMLIGCVGQQPFSKMARSGDTVALALGGSPSHELNANVRKQDMTVSITDNNTEITYPVRLRHLFKLHADPTSKLNYRTMYDYDSGIFFTRFYRQPHLGEWIAVVDLVDPDTLNPLPLTPGPATIHVATTDLVDQIPVYGVPSAEGNLQSIPIEILPGTGSLHTFNENGDPSVLESLPQVEISFDTSQIIDPVEDPVALGDFSFSSSTIVGGIGLTIDYDENYFYPQFPPMVRGGINDPRIHVHTGDVKAGGTNKVLKLIALTDQHGAIANPDPGGYVNYYGRRFSIMENMRISISWDPEVLKTGPIDASNMGSVFQITEATVVDLNGNPILGSGGYDLITPVMSFHD